MFTYIFRGLSVVFALLYTVSSLALSSVELPEIQSDTVMLPSEDIPKKAKESSVQILNNRENTGFLIQQAIDLYSEQAIEKVSISVQTIASESDYHSALRAKLLANESVDMFQINGAREYFELENNLRAFGDFDWIKDACDNTLDAVSHNNKIYGVPYSIEAVGLICNRDAFAEAGISPEKIQSLSDLDEAFFKIQELINLGESETLIEMESVTEFAAADKSFLSEKFADIALSASFSSYKEAALAKDVSFPSAEQIEDLVKILAKYSPNRSDWPKIAQTSDAQQVQSFAVGRVAVILQSTEVYRRINEMNPNMRGRALLVPIPFDYFEQPSVYTSATSYWAINAASTEKNANIAEDFLKWLYTSDKGIEFFASEFGEVSALRKNAKDTGVSLHSQMLNYIGAGLTMPRFHAECPANWCKNVFAPNIQSYFTEREKTWEDVITACETGWNA